MKKQSLKSKVEGRKWLVVAGVVFYFLVSTFSFSQDGYVPRPGRGNVVDTGGQVFNAAAYSGANLGAKIQAAHNAMPSTGGIIDAGVPSLAGAQTLSAITITKPTILKLGNQTLTATGSLTINTAGNVEIRGAGQNVTKITTPNGGPWIVFGSNYSANKNLLAISDNWFLSGTGVSQIISDTSTFPSSLGFNESRFVFTRNRVSNYVNGVDPSGSAIFTGDSFYYSTIRTNNFNNNAYSIRTGRYSDTTIDDNQGISFGQITTYGSSARITNNGFVPSGQTTPDVWIDSGASGNDGYIWIQNNKFGPEGETVAHKKIVIQSTTAATNVIPDVKIIDNSFFGGSTFGQTAIDLLSPIRMAIVRGNYFDAFQYVINDSQPNSTGGIAQEGSVYDGNVETSMTNNGTVGASISSFKNGGRGFNIIRHTRQAATEEAGMTPRSTESAYLVNRLLSSDVYSNTSWWANNASLLTFAAGQTDPYGGTGATEITNPGTSAFANMSAAVTKTAIGSAPAMGSQAVFSFWAKAGTLSTVDVGFRDTTDSAFTFFQRVPLSANWKRYKITVRGINTDAFAAHNYSVVFYPGQSSPALGSSGTILLWHVQVSDSDTDFYPTTGAVASDVTSGARFERPVTFAGGFNYGAGRTAGPTYLSTLGEGPGAAFNLSAFTVGTANNAVYVNVTPRRAMTITKLNWYCNTQSGNYDIGLLDSSGNKLWAKGSTACPAGPAVVTETVSPSVALSAGVTYVLAITFDNTTAKPYGFQSGLTGVGIQLDGTPVARIAASAFPIGNTNALGSTATNRMPLIELREQ